MAHRLLRNVALVGIGVTIGAAWHGLSEAASKVFSHVGQVVEHESRMPLAASVTAWAEMERKGMNGSCPIYGTRPLDQTTSSTGGDGGKFKIGIEQSQRAHTIVYCLNNFVPRIDFEPNHRDGTFVEPTPAQLWLVRMEPTAADGFDNDVERTTIGALNNLSYLMSVNESHFRETMDRLASDFSEKSQSRGGTIRNLRTLVAGWRAEKSQ